MAVRSKTLVVRRILAGVDVTPAYTVGSGETVLVKDVCVDSFNANAGEAVVSIGRGATSCYLVYARFTATGMQRFERWAVLLPGDVINLHAISTFPGFSAGFWISGAELEGLAD